MFGFFGWLWNTVATPVVEVVNKVVSAVVDVVEVVVDTVVDVATDVITGAAHLVLDPIGLEGVADMLDIAETFIDNGVDLVTDIAGNIADSASDLLTLGVDLGESVVTLDVGGVFQVGADVLEEANDILNEAVGADLFEFVDDTLTDVAEIVGDNVDILAPVTDLVGAIVTPLTVTGYEIIDGVQTYLGEPILTGVAGGLDCIGEAITDISFWL